MRIATSWSTSSATGLPLVEDASTTAADTVWEHYDKSGIEISGLWDTDSRLWLKAYAPRPVTVMAAVLSVQTNG